MLILAAACGPGPMATPDSTLAALVAADPGYLSTYAYGDRAPGAACSQGSQCVSGRCTATQDQSCGVCLEVRRLGQSCGGATQVCNWGQVCTNGLCRTKDGDVGAPCNDAPKSLPRLPACDLELHCVRGRGETQATCQRPLPLGAACTDGTLCRYRTHCSAAGFCEADVIGGENEACTFQCTKDSLFCDAHVCRERPRLAVGDACGRVVGSCIDSVCGNANFPFGGWTDADPLTCLALGAEGEKAVYGLCRPGLFADGTTDLICRKRRAAGAACTFAECETGLECHAGRCGPPCQ